MIPVSSTLDYIHIWVLVLPPRWFWYVVAVCGWCSSEIGGPRPDQLKGRSVTDPNLSSFWTGGSSSSVGFWTSVPSPLALRRPLPLPAHFLGGMWRDRAGCKALRGWRDLGPRPTSHRRCHRHCCPILRGRPRVRAVGGQPFLLVAGGRFSTSCAACGSWCPSPAGTQLARASDRCGHR